MLKGGIVASEAVTTVSPTYAEEIQGKVLGCGLDGVLRSRGDRVMGILNGLDYSVWDPETDPVVSHNYPPDVANQKRHNKETLQRACGLSLDANIPVFGFVGRLSYQKGVDLIAQSAREWLKSPIQVVILGVGDEKYRGCSPTSPPVIRKRFPWPLNLTSPWAIRYMRGVISFGCRRLMSLAV